jgi:hypothetical protein
LERVDIMENLNMEVVRELSSVLPGLGSKLFSAIKGVGGRWLAFMTFLSTFIGEEMILAHYILIAILFDLVFGSITSYKNGKFTVSVLLAKTPMKIAIYLTIFTMMAMAESVLFKTTGYVTRLTASLLVVSEVWSILGHILIIKPNFPVVRLLKKQLSTEIEKKLGINLNEELKDGDEENTKVNSKGEV